MHSTDASVPNEDVISFTATVCALSRALLLAQGYPRLASNFVTYPYNVDMNNPQTYLTLLRPAYFWGTLGSIAERIA